MDPIRESLLELQEDNSGLADVVIRDTRDKNVKFVFTSDEGTEKNGVVTWTLKNV